MGMPQREGVVSHRRLANDDIAKVTLLQIVRLHWESAGIQAEGRVRESQGTAARGRQK